MLATGSFPSPQTKQEDLQQSCREFVQQFYDWYVSEAQGPHEGRVTDIALRDKSSQFSVELVRQLKEDSEAQDESPGEIVGLDFDPILNSQDPSERFVVESVKRKNLSYFVEVYGISSGKKMEHVVPELVRKNGRWLIVNFHYPDFKEQSEKSRNLLSILKSLREERQKPAK